MEDKANADFGYATSEDISDRGDSEVLYRKSASASSIYTVNA
jgi:hypothetical protein